MQFLENIKGKIFSPKHIIHKNNNFNKYVTEIMPLSYI